MFNRSLEANKRNDNKRKTTDFTKSVWKASIQAGHYNLQFRHAASLSRSLSNKGNSKISGYSPTMSSVIMLSKQWTYTHHDRKLNSSNRNNVRQSYCFVTVYFLSLTRATWGKEGLCVSSAGAPDSLLHVWKVSYGCALSLESFSSYLWGCS